MYNIKLLLPSLALIMLSACKNKTTTETISTNVVKEKPTIKSTPERTDILAKPKELSRLKKIDTTKLTTPFYAKLEGKKYYIVSNAKKNASFYENYETFKYGIANNDSTILLNVAYDKIYNPNVTLKNCFEIKKEGKIGLYNYRTNKVLEPKFDYILPTLKKEIAYGFKNNKYYIIKSNLINTDVETNVYPNEIKKALNHQFETEDTSRKLYSITYEFDEESEFLYEDENILIMPSYLEYLKLTNSSEYLNTEGDRISGLTLTVKKSVSITEKITSFFVEIYESGASGRGYTLEKENIVVYNKEKNKLNTLTLRNESTDQRYCTNYNSNLLNNSIIETVSSKNTYSLNDSDNATRYNFETIYSYAKIEDDGTLTNLNSSRYYDFTKWVFIDNSYFKGCFANYRENDIDNDDYQNLWSYDHLSIEDLDVMRNEIFADYGYIFTSEKWSTYFNNKTWYTPKHKNVDAFLTKKDKANIKVILSVKEAMLDNEEDYRNKRKDSFYQAG